MRKRRLPVKPSELNTKGDCPADNNWPEAEWLLSWGKAKKQPLAIAKLSPRTQANR